MFTGLIQSLGVISAAAEDGDGGRGLRVSAASLSNQLVIGESVAVNGACMTVTDAAQEWFSFAAGPESLARTTLGTIQVGDPVNLERALRVGDRMGGHFVTGHVDTMGWVEDRRPTGEWETIWFGFSSEWGNLLVPKGSIAVDGISLTVVAAEPARLSVMIIPHTRDHTTLRHRPVGARVNLEFDLLAKHVKKLLEPITRVPHS